MSSEANLEELFAYEISIGIASGAQNLGVVVHTLGTTLCTDCIVAWDSVGITVDRKNKAPALGKSIMNRFVQLGGSQICNPLAPDYAKIL